MRVHRECEIFLTYLPLPAFSPDDVDRGILDRFKKQAAQCPYSYFVLAVGAFIIHIEVQLTQFPLPEYGCRFHPGANML